MYLTPFSEPNPVVHMSQSYSHNMATTQTPHFGILFLDFCVDRAQLTRDCAVARMHICHRHSVGLTSNECAFACAFVLDSVTALTSAVTFAHSNYDNVLSSCCVVLRMCICCSYLYAFGASFSPSSTAELMLHLHLICRTPPVFETVSQIEHDRQLLFRLLLPILFPCR